MQSAEDEDQVETPDEAAEAEVPADDPVVLAEQRAAELAQKLKDTEARLRAVSKAFTDQKGEMAEFRQRVERQEAVRLQRREFEVAQTFFEPVQNLRRSLASATDVPPSFLEGLALVQQQFDEALLRLGLERVAGVGSAFDPGVHEAIGTAPVDDPAHDGLVLMVHEDGFQVGGKVLQAAKVVIGRHLPATPGEA
ncbi:MAG: nucleotide exchange factor GrpE [Alphaproteobacteria bacterium]|nr:nucleotide exchange factor GrpE [Alphaproteobacteria bacterium]